MTVCFAAQRTGQEIIAVGLSPPASAPSMLKDAFNRKPKKDGVDAAEQPSAPAAPTTGRIEAIDDEAKTIVEAGTTQELAALTLQRLIDTYQPPELAPEPEPEPEQLQPQQITRASGIEFTPEPVQPAQCELSGQTINGLYYIHGLLAKGGMGQVLLCNHMARQIPVVMKLMLREANSADTAFQRFIQECKTTHKLRHPNLVKVLDYGILLDGFKPYLVMEFVEGDSLRKILRKRFALMPSDVAKILMQACDGLYEVHNKGIIHRDLKPENLMTRGIPNEPDNVKILDFGIAQLQKDKRFDEEGWAIGSIGYMSPEQVCGQPVDHRTDIYSLGLIFYEAITGKPPFRGRTPKETMAMHVKAPFVPPSQIVQCASPQLVDHICARSLAKLPDERYNDAKEMQRDLAQLLE